MPGLSSEQSLCFVIPIILIVLSYCENRLTRSYERLEFIGDAVLDYLVTIHIYSHLGPETGPGLITDIRSALVCNNMFAR